MTYTRFNTALIVGAGSGLSASLARVLSKEGIKVALAARSTGDLDALVEATGARALTCDASKPADVARLFDELDASFGEPEIVIYNASYRTRGPLIELDPAEVEKSLAVTAFGGFLVAQQAARRMLPKKRGAILFTGASASVKGYALSAPFAMGKFALRGLAQSMARELSPQGIHVAHIVIDGGIKSARREEPADKPASMLDPDAIAASYLHVIHQPHSAWSLEVELRPWVERF
ncbi:MAG: SDR family NAD(P)-dependent oxidoreductase [Xanthobacteraceae bacterium]